MVVAVQVTLLIYDHPVEDAGRFEDFDKYANVLRVRDRILAFFCQLVAIGTVGEHGFDGGVRIIVSFQVSDGDSTVRFDHVPE
jgi:hypothetical protein